MALAARLVPLLSTRRRLTQAGLVLGGPVVFGALCGVLLGTSEVAYLVAIVLSIAGGFLAGFEHPGAGGGAGRGLVGGSLFGASILLAHEIDGRDATASLPNPEVVLVAVTAVSGTLLGALGGSVRRRADTQPQI
jgi:hypothetical protein